MNFKKGFWFFLIFCSFYTLNEQIHYCSRAEYFYQTIKEILEGRGDEKLLVPLIENYQCCALSIVPSAQETILHYLARNNQFCLMERLIEGQEEGWHVIDEKGNNLAHAAAGAGAFETLNLLINKESSIFEEKNGAQATPLEWAIHLLFLQRHIPEKWQSPAYKEALCKTIRALQKNSSYFY